MSKCNICKQNITANDVTNGEILFKDLGHDQKAYWHTSCVAKTIKAKPDFSNSGTIELEVRKKTNQHPEIKTSFLWNKVNEEEIYFPINIPLKKEKVVIEKPVIQVKPKVEQYPTLVKVETKESRVKEEKMSKLTKIEKDLEKLEPLRIKGLLKNRKETLEQFLEKFFTKWNDEKETIYVESKRQQTAPGKRRSIGDLHRIVKYYYPETTLAELTKFLYNNNIPHFRSSNCSTINKRVFYYDKDDDKRIMEKTQKDEFGLVVSDYLNEE